jgi:hypothetical protein
VWARRRCLLSCKAFSMVIVLAVGLTAIAFFRRKTRRFMWPSVMDCINTPQRILKHKNSMVSKASEMVVSDHLSHDGATGGESNEWETERYCFFLRSTTPLNQPKHFWHSLLQQVTTSRSEYHMPAITMEWKRPKTPKKCVSNEGLRRPLEALALRKSASLRPERFESMWEEYVQR